MILGCQRGPEFETCAGVCLEVDMSPKGLSGMGSKSAIQTSVAARVMIREYCRRFEGVTTYSLVGGNQPIPNVQPQETVFG